jgi:hypothetical protein
MRQWILVLLCVSLIIAPSYAGAAGLTLTYLQGAGNGVTWYDAMSAHNGPGSTILRILEPTNPAPGMPRRFIYVLPVITDVDLQSEFGDGLEELLALNIHNAYNAYVIAPSFRAVPWYADHDSISYRKYEAFMVHDLVPWVQANLSVTGQEEHWLIGFSKSGFGAVTLLFRNPTVFNAAAAWDFPADQSDPYIWDMLDNYGTNANFQNNYRLTSEWIAARRQPFLTAPRLWLSDDYAHYYGTPTFRDEVLAFAGRLLANDVQFSLEASGTIRPHTWTSGWLPEAVAGLQDMRYGTPNNSVRDDFNRPDGGLGSNWLVDPLWGTGMGIASNQVRSSAGGGGAYYWNAGPLGSDQYSQVRITGDIGVWTGVSVRSNASPSQGYWVAIKDDGAYLYSYLNGEFYQLVHEATPWSTGDVLRLEARTVATNTARLTVYRNGLVLFTHDDAAHFIANGQPGIGMYATAAMALDDWEGGTLNSGSTPDTTPPVRSNGAPSGTLAAGTTQTTLSLTTNENATCRYATSSGVAYGSMPNTFATTGGTAHSATRTGLTNGSSYSFFVRCQDPTGNANTYDFTIAFSVAQPADTTPPVRSNGSPAGTLAAGTTQATLSLTTNESATCRYATSPGVAYSAMPNTFATTGGTAHSTTVTSLNNGSSYSFFVRCQDPTGNANTNDFTIAFSVAQSADAGLVAAYGFNEGAGTSAADASGRGHTGVVSGALWTAAGRFGNALSFDGVNDMVTVVDSALLDLTTGMTLSAWIFPTAHGNGVWRNVLIKERPGGEVYNLYSNTDTNVPTVYVVRNAAPGTPLEARGTAQVPLNTWTHLAATHDGATLRLYVNGAQIGSRAVSGSLLTSTGALRIGGNAVWGEFFQGRIDEVRIYNRALSPGEIQNDMTRPITP